MTLEKIVDNFSDTKILVVGDVMLDHYIYGRVTRISPEAPVPVLCAHDFEQKYLLGGAANVAANIASLGGKVYLCGVIGNDRYGAVFKEVAESYKVNTILYRMRSIPTTRKVRPIADGHQLLRIDFEEGVQLDSRVGNKLLKKIKPVIDCVDVVVLSDYNKGVFSSSLEFNHALVGMAKKLGKPVLSDPKPDNMDKFPQVDCISPNLKEAFDMAHLKPFELKDKEEELRYVAHMLFKRYLPKYVTITCGRHGIYAYVPSQDGSGGNGKLISTKAKEVYDVTGAGDTSLAVMAMAWASGANFHEACELANVAGGIVVGKVGTATLTQKEIKENL